MRQNTRRSRGYLFLTAYRTLLHEYKENEQITLSIENIFVREPHFRRRFTPCSPKFCSPKFCSPKFWGESISRLFLARKVTNFDPKHPLVSLPSLTLNISASSQHNKPSDHPQVRSTLSVFYACANLFNSVAKMVKIRKFKLFPKLAPELRQMIFELAIPDGQIVEITMGALSLDLKAKYRIPALLHVNREARSFAESFYEKMFADRLGGNPLYIDVSRDVLAFESQSVALLFARPDVDQQLPLIAFHHELYKLAQPDIFRLFGDPKHIIILTADARPSHRQMLTTARARNAWTGNYHGTFIPSLPSSTFEVVMCKEMKAKLVGLIVTRLASFIANLTEAWLRPPNTQAASSSS